MRSQFQGNVLDKKPHIVFVLARGETVRNFLYSDTLRILSQNARVTLLSAITDANILGRFTGMVERIVPLHEYPERNMVKDFSYVLHMAHYRWLKSQASKYHWAADYNRSTTLLKKIRLVLLKILSIPLAQRPILEMLTPLEQTLTWRLRPTRDFDMLFDEIQPDLVFNGSHIHGPLADLPMRVAHRMGIPTAAFIFSWDNLTSRSRIFVPYDYYLVWTDSIRRHFLELYPHISPERVFVTGTPQFDFHFKPEFWLDREELCARIGIDPSRPYVLYTTGYAKDFPDEYKIVKDVINYVQELDMNPKPQLVVRTYLKGNSPEMDELACQNISGVVFPTVRWEKKWLTPLYEDLFIYTNLLRHASLGINAASTVSLELMMLDKPVINLAFEPPGSNPPYWTRFARHVEYEHYLPVVQSGGVMVARSLDDLHGMIYKGLTDPLEQSQARRRFIHSMFGDTLDGQSGERIAGVLLEQARKCKEC